MALIMRPTSLFCKAKTCRHFTTDKSGYSISTEQGISRLEYATGCGYDNSDDELYLTITEEGKCPYFDERR